MTFKTLAKGLALLPLALVLIQCDRITALLEQKPEKAGPYAFDLVLKMSPKADAYLKNHTDGLFLDAFYYGQAAPAYQGEADKMNRIYLGREQSIYAGNARKLHLNGEPFDTSALPKITGQPQVLLSVDENGGDPEHPRVACRDYFGPIRQAQQQSPVLYCEFDSEHYWEDTAASSSAN